MPDFRSAKKGDQVFSIVNGYGKVVNVTDDGVIVDFRDSTGWQYCWDGRNFSDDELPTLFWDKPEISDPPKPKKIIKKEQDVWINIYPKEDGSRYHTLWMNEEDANFYSHKNKISTIKAKLEWEEEE